MSVFTVNFFFWTILSIFICISFVDNFVHFIHVSFRGEFFFGQFCPFSFVSVFVVNFFLDNFVHFIRISFHVSFHGKFFFFWTILSISFVSVFMSVFTVNFFFFGQFCPFHSYQFSCQFSR